MVISVFGQMLKLSGLTAEAKPKSGRFTAYVPGECEEAQPMGTNCITCGILKKWTEFFVRKDTNKYRGECKACYLKRQEKYRKKKNVANDS